MNRMVISLVLAAIVLSPATAEEDTEIQQTVSHEIVVTATRIETPRKEIASSVTVLTSAELRPSDFTAVIDTLAPLAGTSIQRNGGPGSVSSIFLRGANSEHTLVLVDGIEVNDPASPSRAFDFAHLTLDLVDRIEILRGPQSTLFGSDALGGVINIMTARGSGKPRTEFSGSAGSYGTWDSRLSFRGSSGQSHYALSLSALKSDGISAASIAYPGNTESDGYRNLTLAGRAGTSLRNNIEADLVFRASVARTEMDNFGGPYGDDPNSLQDFGSFSIRGELRGLFVENRWEQKLGLSFARSKREYTNDPDEIHPFDSERGLYEGSRVKIEWRNNLFFHSSHTLTFGAEAASEFAESSYVSEGFWGPFVSDFPGKRARSAGVYLQDQVRWGGRFFATAGVRLDTHSRAGTSVTYRLAPAFLIESTGTRLKATVGSGFKSPSLYQLYAPGTAWGPIGNAALEPESCLGWDAGIDQRLFDGKVLFEVVRFHNAFRNLIQFDFGLGFVNIGRAVTQGTEISLEARPGDGLSLRASYTRLSAEDTDTKTPLLRRPADKFGGTIFFRFLGKGEARLQLTHTGERLDRDFTVFPSAVVTLPAYTLLDASLSFRAVGGLTPFLRIENLLDAQYETVFGYGTMGRSFAAGFRLGL
jgi:vitamin B12 transporter